MLDPDPTRQPQLPDEEEGVGGKQVGDQPTQAPRYLG
jgi:hypothetical protein